MHTASSANDEERSVVRVTADSGSAQPGTPVCVLVHGVGMSHRYHRRLHRALEDDIRVVSIDLPGFGGVPRPAGDIDIPAMGRMLADAVSALDCESVVLIGHSMGTQWAIEAAVALGDAAAAVVLIGPVVDDAHRSMRAQARALAIDTMGESPVINAIVLTDYLRCGIRWHLRQARHMLDYSTLERIRTLTVPVLIIRGSRDPVAGREWCRRLVNAAKDARLVEVPGHHHIVQYSAPRAVSGAIRQSLAVSRQGGWRGNG